MSEKKTLLKGISLENLHYALQYSESIASSARDSTGELLKRISEHKFDKSKYDPELKKLHEVFKEHDELTFHIEAEMDRRFKPMLKTRYTTKTLLDISTSVKQKFISDMKSKNTGSDNDQEKPKLQLS